MYKKYNKIIETVYIHINKNFIAVLQNYVGTITMGKIIFNNELKYLIKIMVIQ